MGLRWDCGGIAHLQHADHELELVDAGAVLVESEQQIALQRLGEEGGAGELRGARDARDLDLPNQRGEPRDRDEDVY